MKLAMKHRSLCSMSFVMRICTCVIFLCLEAVLLCACNGYTGRLDGSTGSGDITREDIAGEGVVRDGAEVLSTAALESDSITDTASSLEGQPVTRKGYNPQMDFVYDEHDDIDIDDEYVGSLCGEAAKELETMFGPAEFYITADSNEDGSYTVNIRYNENTVTFSDNELQQIRMYINQEYKEVTLSEINIQGW